MPKQHTTNELPTRWWCALCKRYIVGRWYDHQRTHMKEFREQRRYARYTTLRWWRW